MRRWRLLNRFWHGRALRGRGRVLLVLEELEGREVLAPLVLAPVFQMPPQTLEGQARTFSDFTADSFSVTDSGTPPATYPVVATLRSTSGTFFINPSFAGSREVSVDGNDSAVLTLSGSLDDIDAVLGLGFAFTPTDGYTGDADIGLIVTSLGEAPETAAGSFVLQVISESSLAWATEDEVRVRTEPFAFPPGFLTVTDWSEANGTETFSVTLSLFDPSEREREFTLAANGVTIPIVGNEPGLWLLEGTDPTAFQALLDALVLTPPADYSGRVGLAAFGSVRETVPPANGPPKRVFLDAGTVSLRFFEAARFTAPPAFVLEGAGPIDLGGRYAVDDPAELEEDSHSLTLSVPRGTLTFDPTAVPDGLSAGRDGNTILLTGDLRAINEFLAKPGSLRYAPESASTPAVYRSR